MEGEEGFIPKEQVLDRVPKRIRELQFGILYEMTLEKVSNKY